MPKLPHFLFTTFLLLSLTGCSGRKFLMKGGDFSLFSNGNHAHTGRIRQLNEGVYVAKICRLDTIVDGARLNLWQSCPDSAFTSRSLEKTLFLIFPDNHRAVYFTRTPFFASQGALLKSAQPDFELDFTQSRDGQKSRLQGYYRIRENPAVNCNACYEVHLELEGGASKKSRLGGFRKHLVTFNLQLNGENLRLNEIAYPEESGFSTQTSNQPPRPLDGVFHTNLEFRFFPAKNIRYRLGEEFFTRVEVDLSGKNRTYWRGGAKVLVEDLNGKEGIRTW